MTSPRQIPISPAAHAALDQLRARHGRLVLHVTGGCCDAGTPLCLAEGEIILGQRDLLQGVCDGVPLYRMGDEAVECPVSLALDVEPGRAVGFSLDIGDGTRFVLKG
jgi:uncharacterized protein (DUF779 family)